MVKVTPGITDEISVLAGDCVHNLRSTLDHVAWHLATDKDQRPLLEFPIYDRAGPGNGTFQTNGLPKIDSLPRTAKAVIEHLQPYYSGSEALLQIQRLDNVDKHRHMLATPYFLHQAGFTPPSGEGVVRLPDAIFQAGRYKDGNEIMSAVPSDPADTGRLDKMVLKGTFQIILEEEGVSGEIAPELRRLYEFVGSVVLPEFEPFF
jgi:hypothetical protein